MNLIVCPILFFGTTYFLKYLLAFCDNDLIFSSSVRSDLSFIIQSSILSKKIKCFPLINGSGKIVSCFSDRIAFPNNRYPGKVHPGEFSKPFP